MGTQTDIESPQDVEICKQRVIQLEKEVKELKEDILKRDEQIKNLKLLVRTEESKVDKLETKQFRLRSFKDNDSKINFYTGIPTFKRLQNLFKFLKEGEDIIYCFEDYNELSHNDHEYIQRFSSRKKSYALDKFNQFFLVLCRLQQGFLEDHLAYLFDVSQSCVSRYCISWINYMYLVFGSIDIWPSREMIDLSMPSVCQLKYPNLRVTIDCFEIKTESPESLLSKGAMYSHYKNHMTLKGLIGIAPSGSISFISQLYPGSCSDREIVLRSGFLNRKLWASGDMILADRGFTVQDLFSPMQVLVNIPAFLHGRTQFTEEEVVQTQQIANFRVHVERAIQRVKSFHIVDGVIPVSLFGSINQIWTVLCFLANLKDPLISQ